MLTLHSAAAFWPEAEVLAGKQGYSSPKGKGASVSSM